MNTSLGKRVNDIIESYNNGQRKQMIAQYEDAIKAFYVEDVVLMIRLADIPEESLIHILTTLLMNSTTKKEPTSCY